MATIPALNPTFSGQELRDCLVEMDGEVSGKAEESHTHSISDISDAGSAAASDANDFAAANHTHAYADLTGKPTLGTAAASDTGDFATASHTHTLSDISDAGTAAASDTGDFASAAQGALADSAVQPGDLISDDANNQLSGQVKFWVGSQSDYDALGSYDANTIYDVVS